MKEDVVVENSITNFEQHVQHLIQSAGSVQNSSFRKVLYLVMVDGLFVIRYPKHKRARDRFVTFITKYGRWEDCERISLPQAKLYLDETSEDPVLLETVSKRLADWPYGQIHNLKRDPSPSKLPGSEKLRRCQHRWLIWELRNSLLHSFQHPAFAHDNLSSQRDSPFYHGIADQEGRWLLAVPDEFLRQLALNCLDEITKWLRSEQIDPKMSSKNNLWVRVPPKRNPNLWFLMVSVFLGAVSLIGVIKKWNN